MSEAADAQRLQLLEQLESLLEQELQALLQRHEAGVIEQLAARKAELCARLEALPQPGADPSGALGELAQAVAQANQRNGAVVAALLRNTRGALDLLRGGNPAARAGVYGPRGEAASGDVSRPLGAA